jgi:hypothetical protein
VGRYTAAYFIWSYPVTYLITGVLYVVLRKCGVWRPVSSLAWGFPVIAYFILSGLTGWQDSGHLNSQRVQVLYRTDPVVLLSACRDVMTNRNTFAKNRPGKDDSSIDPKDPKLPVVIVALQPRYISAENDWMSLELHGGIDRLHVIAYSEQTAASHTNDLQGLLLTPGLWFYDAELSYQQTDRAAYITRLKAMKPDDALAPKSW